MIRLGTAFKSSSEPFHRLLVISDPETNGGQIVLVRITTDDGSWPDRDCILEPGDWSELEHRSTVAYSTAKFGAVAERLEAAISKGDFRVITSPPYDTLRRIIMAGRGSRGISPAAARLLAKL